MTSEQTSWMSFFATIELASAKLHKILPAASSAALPRSRPDSMCSQGKRSGVLEATDGGPGSTHQSPGLLFVTSIFTCPQACDDKLARALKAAGSTAILCQLCGTLQSLQFCLLGA